MIPVNRPLIDQSDIDAITCALTDTYISGEAPAVRQMEERLSKETGTTNSVAISTGTAAIDLVVEALEIKPGDHCVVPDFTIISTVSNLLRKGATLEFIDADPETWSIDATAAAEAIGAKTKLVLPVHIYGLSADMDPILKSAKNFGSFVLEDAAEALGVTYKGKPCGSLGDAAIFSFYANKIVTGGEGGAVTTNDSGLARKLASLRNLAHGEERFVHDILGWNARISGLSAVLINSQLVRLYDLLEKKRDIARQYLDGLEGHPWFEFMPTEVEYSRNAYWVFPILLNDESPFCAREFQLKLKELGVETRRFFHPMHLQPVMQKYKTIQNSDYRISTRLWERGIYLPSGLGNSPSEIAQVIDVLWLLPTTIKL